MRREESRWQSVVGEARCRPAAHADQVPGLRGIGRGALGSHKPPLGLTVRHLFRNIDICRMRLGVWELASRPGDPHDIRHERCGPRIETVLVGRKHLP
jgi:hypothetical protein